MFIEVLIAIFIIYYTIYIIPQINVGLPSC